MAIKKWQVFEQVVKEIMKNQYSKFPFKISHNIKMKGSISTHQIDIYLLVKLPMLDLRQIVDAKHWSNNVDKKEVGNILSIKNDLAVHNAIIVSKKGFQKGAIELAKGNGIQLIKISEPDEIKIKKVLITEISKYPEVKDFEIILEPNALNIGKTFEKDYQLGDYNKETNLYDSSGKIVQNIKDIVDYHYKLLLKSRKKSQWFNYINIDPPLFQKIDGKLEKINSFNFVMEIHEDKTEKEVPLDESKLIAHDLTNDSIWVINKPYNYDML